MSQDDELGYERGDPAGAGSGNSRNGYTAKTVSTANGPVTINVPRDHNGVFEPRIVPKHARRLGQIDEMILSLYSRGMTTRDIEAHLHEVYGVTASQELISKVTDVAAEEIELWRNRPVDEVYPIVYVDGIRIKVRDQGAVTVKVAYLVIGVDVEGRKHALGIWIAALRQLDRCRSECFLAMADDFAGLGESVALGFHSSHGSWAGMLESPGADLPTSPLARSPAPECASSEVLAGVEIPGPALLRSTRRPWAP